MDPGSGKDITDDFVSDSKNDMQNKLVDIFLEADSRKSKGEAVNEIYNDLSGKIKDAVTGHFQSLKQPPDEQIISNNLKTLSTLLGL